MTWDRYRYSHPTFYKKVSKCIPQTQWFYCSNHCPQLRKWGFRALLGVFLKINMIYLRAHFKDLPQSGQCVNDENYIKYYKIQNIFLMHASWHCVCVTVNILSGGFQYDDQDQVNCTHMHLCSVNLNNSPPQCGKCDCMRERERCSYLPSFLQQSWKKKVMSSPHPPPYATHYNYFLEDLSAIRS